MRGTMKRRNNRQDAIRDIVRNKSVRTQRALVDELEEGLGRGTDEPLQGPAGNEAGRGMA